MKVDRLVSIIMLLLAQKRISAQELADRFEVSLRTIYRDIDTINRAGIPVYGLPGVGGGFEIMPDYKVDKNVFSSSELATILTGLSSLPHMMGGEALASTLAKVNGMIPADKAKDIALKADQIAIDLSPWMGNETIQPYIEKIKTAIQENKLLAFEYVSHHGDKTRRTAEPYQLILKGNHWYWQGYCYQRKAFRLFKLCRTFNLQILEEAFTPRPHEKPQLAFQAAFDVRQTVIKLRIHQSIMDRVLDFCPYENFESDGKEHYIVNFPFIENDYYYDMLLSFGEQCECLAPLEIRAEIKRRIHQMAALYD